MGKAVQPAACLAGALVLLTVAGGCVGPRARQDWASSLPPVRRVICIYGENPWLNLDRYGDRDPEGVWYNVYLSTGAEPGVHRPGWLEVELYRLVPTAEGTIERVQDAGYRYATSEVPVIKKPGMMGDGYVIMLMWPRKDTAGCEIELVTTYEDPDGRRVRAETKSLRVPRYTRG